MRKQLKFVALCLLAALVLAWFGWNLNWAEVSADIGRADWRMIAAAVVLVWLTYLIRAFRWRTLLAPLAPRASLREAFAATTVGFGAIFLAGRAVGEVLRPAFLCVRDREVRPGPAFVTIAVERIFDTSAVVVLFAANMLVNTDEGDTFSFEEIQGWLTEAGFKDARLLEAPGPSPLVLATKP